MTYVHAYYKERHMAPRNDKLIDYRSPWQISWFESSQYSPREPCGTLQKLKNANSNCEMINPFPARCWARGCSKIVSNWNYVGKCEIQWITNYISISVQIASKYSKLKTTDERKVINRILKRNIFKLIFFIVYIKTILLEDIIK